VAIPGSHSLAIHHPLLVDVAELRVTVAKISDLLLIQAIESVVALSQIALSVLPLRVDNASDGQEQYAALTHQIDCVTCVVFRCVLRNICPRREDTTSCADRDNVCRGNSADGWVTSIVGCPREETGTSRKCSNRDQEDTSVTGIRVRDPSHNGETCNGRNREDGEIETTAVGLVTDESDCDGNETSADVGRDGVELSFGSGPSKVVENSRLENGQY
jgi:hypothetical protein